MGAAKQGLGRRPRGGLMRVVFLGLSVTSRLGNQHAIHYRALMRELDARGHDAVFLERDVPWYASARDLPDPPFGRTYLYSSVGDLRARFAAEVRGANLVVVGSCVPEGVAVGGWVCDTARGTTAFYDFNTPGTLARLERGDCRYISTALIPRYDMYLSFAGGAALERLERRFGARQACAFYPVVDPFRYRPRRMEAKWDLGYLGPYSDARQPQLEALLLDPARKLRDSEFVVAGREYPPDLAWPENVERLEHVPPPKHPAFYAAQRWTLNITGGRTRRAEWAPSVRLFQAAACGIPVISERCDGLEQLFADGKEILIADRPSDVVEAIWDMPDDQRRAIGGRARRRVLAEHTPARRIDQLELLLARTI
jgi:spore maturation protein CgeB